MPVLNPVTKNADGTVDLGIGKGSHYALVITIEGTDLTNYTARAQAREKYDSPTTLFDLTTENGGLVIAPGTGGVITLIVASSLSSAITAKKGVWDMEIVNSNGTPTRVMEGKVAFSPETTR